MDRRDFLLESVAASAAMPIFLNFLSGKPNLPVPPTEQVTLRMKVERSYTVCIADKVNKNKRLYPRKVLEAAIEKLKNREVLGVMGMPQDTIVKFSEVSHKANNLRLEGNELKCEIEILKTPNGKILEELLKTNSVEFRTSGIGGGQVNDDGILVIGDSFCLTSINALPLGEGS
jgi:hypothetical protein